jgi:multicomponent K+:H+ antiporter subunit G
VFHEVLIIGFVTVTTPISLMVLVRAAVFRDASESKTAPEVKMENERR